MKKTFFIYQIAKSTVYYAAWYALCERALKISYNIFDISCQIVPFVLKEEGGYF